MPLTIVVALVSALLVVGLTVSDALRRAKRRAAHLRIMPVTPLAPEPRQPLHLTAGALLGGLVGLLVVYHLAVSIGAAPLKSRFTTLALALAASVCSVHLLAQLHMLHIGGEAARHSPAQRTRGEEVLAILAFLLMTAAVGVLATLFLPRSHDAFARNVHIAGIIAAAVMSAFWRWLAGVWRQQLDGGVPWTTAGRLIPAARAMSLICAIVGLLGAIAVWLRPAPGG